MQILLMAHSGIRWLVVAAALVTLIVCAIVWLRKQQGKMERTWMSIFTGVLDLQTLLGIIYLIWSDWLGQAFHATASNTV